MENNITNNNAVPQGGSSAAHDKVQKKEVVENKSVGSKIVIILTSILIFPIFMWIGSRNKFKKEAVEIETSVSQIDIYLRKRFDMLTKMIDSIKGSMKFEQATLTKVTEMRTGINSIDAGSVESTKQLSKIENEMNSVQRSINVQMEAYPELKSADLVKTFLMETANVEEDLAAARRIYNRNVKRYNIRIKTFPSNVMANAMGLVEWNLYEVAEYVRQDVKVDFGF